MRHLEAEIDPPCEARLYRDEPPPLPPRRPTEMHCSVCQEVRQVVIVDIGGTVGPACVPCWNSSRDAAREAAEWAALGPTDIIGMDELTRPVFGGES
jgi:hypothetical protein